MICDDNDTHNKILSRYLQDYARSHNHTFIIHSANEPFKSIQLSTEHSVDIALLDIDLGKFCGIDLGKRLKKIDPSIHLVYITSFPDFAISAIKSRAYDYVLKPITPQKLETMLMEYFDQKNQTSQHEGPYIILDIPQGIIKQEIHNVLYIEKVGRHVFIHTTSESIRLSITIKELLNNPSINQYFIQCHQSILINASKIVSYKKQFVRLRDVDHDLPVSRGFKQQVQSKFMNHLMENKVGELV